MSAIADLTSQRDRFLAFVERRINDRAVAEDILQTAYTRAISHAPALRTADSANAWFFRILRNAIVDHYRHHAVEARTFEAWTAEVDPQAPSFDPAPANTCRCLHRALSSLSSPYRNAIQQVDLSEAPLDSFAAQSEITLGNAAVRVHRAHKALRKQLFHRCGSCAQAGCLDCTCQPESSRLNLSPRLS